MRPKATGVVYHPVKDVELTLHVNNFWVVGEEECSMELKRQLQEVYELRATVIGSDDIGEKKSIYLGRTIRW